MKTMKKISPRFLALTVLTLLALAQRAKAQDAPDTANFDNTPVAGPIVDNNGTAFQTGGAGTWAIVDGSGNLPTQNLQNTSGSGDSFVAMRYGNLASGTETGFTESTDFIYSAVTTSGSSFTNVGLGADTYNSIYYGNGTLAQFVIGSTDTTDAGETTGNLIISTDSGYGTRTTLAYATSGLTPTIGDKYTLTLTGIYDYSGANPNLNLYVSITDDTTGTSSALLTTTLADAPAAAGLYGIADSSSGSSTATVNFDNYSIDLATEAPVPEPSSWMLLGLGLAAISMRLRRTALNRIG